jgi:hypothetical protein
MTMPKRSAITGIEITKENDILICDWQNDKLLIYNEDGSFIAEPPLDGGDPYNGFVFNITLLFCDIK